MTAAENAALQVLSALRLPVLRRWLWVIFPLITPRPCKLTLFLVDCPLFRLRVRVDHLVAAAHTRAHACQPTSMLLACVCSIMPQLVARLSLSRVSQARVYITGGSSAEGRGRGRLGRFFPMVTLHQRIIGLAWHFGRGVGGEGAVGGRRARREGFGAEFWSGVVTD